MDKIDLIGAIILGAMILFFMIGIPWAVISDYRKFNHGRCRKCGKPLTLRMFDSQGGRLYCCDNICDQVWISWPVDK